MIVQFRKEKVSNHGSIPITIDCNVVAFIVFEERFHQPIKRTKQACAEIFPERVEIKVFLLNIVRIFVKGIILYYRVKGHPHHNNITPRRLKCF
ncbi:hypothetical protein TNCV_3930171 [Trichonephila clavipes]|nr:hypothetical protein TNCV_3930171 [Trichonephila clavipes]